jgi:hypothetical protein
MAENALAVPFTKARRRRRTHTNQLDSVFVICSHRPIMDQNFKIVQVEGGRDELVATAGNFQVARAAYDTAVSVWPKALIELRQGARVVLKNGE